MAQFVKLRQVNWLKIFIDQIKGMEPLEAVKTLKGRKYVLYCKISGSEPSSAALLNRQRKPDYCAATSMKYTKSVNQRHISKRGQI